MATITQLSGLEAIKKFAKGLANMLVDRLKPRFADGDLPLPLGLRKKMFPPQAIRVESLARQLEDPRERTALLMGDMGVGKTLMALAVAQRLHLARQQRGDHRPFNLIVAAPPTLVTTWEQEVAESMPEGSVQFVDFFDDKELPQKGINMQILSYSRLRMHFASEFWAITTFRSPAVVERLEKLRDEIKAKRGGFLSGVEIEHLGCPTTQARCPRCGHRFVKPGRKEKDLPEPLTLEDLQRQADTTGRAIACPGPRFKKDWHSTAPRREKVRTCGEILVRPSHTKARTGRFCSQAYIAKKRLRNQIDLIIGDEFHSLKNDGVQGKTGRWLMNTGQKILALTGTLTGGYAHDLFFLLWSLSYRELRQDGYSFTMLPKFCAEYGSKETTEKVKGDKTVKVSKTMTGISAAIYEKYLVSRSVFMGLEDLERDLCPYTEHRVALPMTEPMQIAYTRVASEFKRLIGAAHGAGFKLASQLVSKYLHATLSWPDRLREDKVDGKLVKYDKDGNPIDEFAIHLDLTELVVEKTPKDQWLIELVKKEKRRGRKVLVYATYTNERDCTARIKAVLEKEGLRVGLLRASSVTAAKRKEWIDAKTSGLDALICHPDLVKEGLNLIQFPTIVWLQPDYNIYRLRQASRRSRRPTQTEPVEVYFVYYENTTQEQAMCLIASKLDSALLAEGNPADSALFEISYSPDSVFRGLINALIDGSDVELKLRSRLVTEEFLPMEETETQEEQADSTEVTITPPDPNRKVHVTLRRRVGRRMITVTEEFSLEDVPSGHQLALFSFAPPPAPTPQTQAMLLQ